MCKLLTKIMFIFVLIAFFDNSITGQQLRGRIGSSKQWCSGWIELRTTMNFHTGDTLIIHVGGTARRVIVRLLPSYGDANSPDIIIGGPRALPVNRTLKVILESDYENIKQISVHGGPEPFNISLGQDNGCATLLSAVLKRLRH